MIPPRVLNALAVLLLAAGDSSLTAQIATSSPAPRPSAPTVEKLRKSLDEIKADTTLDDAGKEAASKRVGDAITHLETAADFDSQTAILKNDVAQGPTETESLRKEIDQRRAGKIPKEATAEADLPADADSEMIAARLTAERIRIAELGKQIRVSEELISQLQGRPAANRERIVAATRQLSETESGTSKWNGRVATTPQEKADFAYEHALIQSLRSELATLEQEALSFDIRGDLLEARRDLAASDLALSRERVVRLENRSGELVNASISEAERLIKELGLQSVIDAPKVRDLVNESRDLAQKNQTLLSRIAAADVELNQSSDDLDRLRHENENVRAQVEIGGLEDSFAEIALELRRTLPTQQSLRGVIEKRHKEISTARLEAFRADRDLDDQPSPQGQVEEMLELFRSNGVDEESLTKLRPGLNEFVGNRTKLRRDFVDGNRRLATLLGEIDLVSSETLATADSMRDFLGERLVWVASSPPLGKNAFTGLRTSFLALLGPVALVDYGEAVSRIGYGHWIIAGLLGMILLLPRRRLRRHLAALAARTRHLSTDHIGNTLTALFVSFWLALPTPVLLGFFGWVFTSDPLSTSSTFALGKGLMAPAVLLLILRFASILCWTGGVAEGHFRSKRDVLDPLHRGLISLIFLYFPAHLLLAIWWHNENDLSAFQGPGRLVFVVSMITVTLILRSFFSKNEGVLKQIEPPKGSLRRLRRVWIAIAQVIPLAFAVLASIGHFLTAVSLAFLTQKTGIVIFSGILVYALLTRWASIRGRRMALADALAQREARRASQESSEDGTVKDDSSDSPSSDEAIREEILTAIEDDEPVDWSVVGEQTRHLIRAVVTLTVIFGCWLAWSDALPVLKYLDTRTLFAGISLSDLIWLGLITVITGIVFQNLPGLLELGFLRALELESGVRNAFITISQYVVIAIGTTLGFHVIGLDWSSFGWIAAALSVGLGFGLQEVVANFVSGLILLFERPIRVGDIVTVGGVDGVVTKIRIRATTITNWDKKEFIVPNKEFITGTILNWTLSNPVTRLVFPVGIAYGSDLPKAREILLEIARSQPEVLKDPAPGAFFELFGDSSLNFTLRCFLPTPDQRLEMTHRINSLIHDRFVAAGIEIPFPQRDLHLRSVDAGVRLERGPESPAQT